MWAINSKLIYWLVVSDQKRKIWKSSCCFHPNHWMKKKVSAWSHQPETLWKYRNSKCDAQIAIQAAWPWPSGPLPKPHKKAPRHRSRQQLPDDAWILEAGTHKNIPKAIFCEPLGLLKGVPCSFGIKSPVSICQSHIPHGMRTLKFMSFQAGPSTCQKIRSSSGGDGIPSQDAKSVPWSGRLPLHQLQNYIDNGLNHVMHRWFYTLWLSRLATGWILESFHFKS